MYTTIYYNVTNDVANDVTVTSSIRHIPVTNAEDGFKDIHSGYFAASKEPSVNVTWTSDSID